MSFVTANGIKLAYDTRGDGPAVLLAAPAGADRKVWRYQVPVLAAAGYRVITFNHRGIAPSAEPGAVTLTDLIGDTACLIEALGAAPCGIVGVSLGAFIAQELAATSPQLVAAAVLMGTKARQDVFREALGRAQAALGAVHGALEPEVRAVLTALQYLSPATLGNDVDMPAWLYMFGQQPAAATAHAGIDCAAGGAARLANVTCPCLVMGFGDDLIAPPHLCREVAEAIPDGRYLELAGCGHLGYLEQPGLVSKHITDFFAATFPPGRAAPGGQARREAGQQDRP